MDELTFFLACRENRIDCIQYLHKIECDWYLSLYHVGCDWSRRCMNWDIHGMMDVAKQRKHVENRT